jgi:hypothetical protein
MRNFIIIYYYIYIYINFVGYSIFNEEYLLKCLFEYFFEYNILVDYYLV